MTSHIPLQLIEQKIHVIRGQKVMLDKDLANLYQVKSVALRQQVKRNRNRFPGDFLFRLTDQEANLLVSQNVIPSKQFFGGFLPYAFTEQGVAMLSSVLKSSRAAKVNVFIMRAFIKLREVAFSHRDLTQRINTLEMKFDIQFKIVFDAIRKMMNSPRKIERIGFKK